MELLKNYSLRTLNTFGIEAMATYYAGFENTDELKTLLALKATQDGPLMILGGGSNILLTQDFKGVVLKNNIKGITLVKEDENHIYVKAGAGEVWHEFVLYCIAHQYAGVENLSLIPGTVGAAPMQNIGAYGAEIKDVFDQLEALHIESGRIDTFDLSACHFGYRESVFKKELKGQYVITSVTFKLNKKALLNTSYGAIASTMDEMGIKQPSIKAVSDAVIHIRRTKLPDPASIGNAGSFFKNPEITISHFGKLQEKFPEIVSYPLPNGNVKVPAGWLIEQCGWKGKVVGQTGVHKNQALVLVNYGYAKGADIKQLSLDVKASVKEKFGIELETEVNII